MSAAPKQHWVERPLRAFLKAVRFVVIRTDSGPLRVLWGGVWSLVMRASVAWLRRLSPDATVYVRGSFARGDVAHGLSDIDLIVVTPDGESESVNDRIVSAYGSLPLIKDIVEISAYDRSICLESMRAPFTTWPVGPRARLAMSSGLPPAGARIMGPLRKLRLLSGAEVPCPAPRASQYDLLWVWTDLQFHWKHLFRHCADPGELHVDRNLAKAGRDLAKLMVWLEFHERLDDAQAVDRFMEAYPEDADAMEASVRGAKADKDPALRQTLGLLARICRRVSRHIDREAVRAGSVSVRLAGNVHADRWPLLDWRGRTLVSPAEDSFQVVGNRVDEPNAIAAAARMERANAPMPALVQDGVMVLPSARRSVKPLSPAMYRGVHCKATDPVSFGLIAGARRVGFPELPGWSIGHSTARAADQFTHWLEDAEERPNSERLAGLFQAARTALLWESLEAGSPELALDAASIGREFGETGRQAVDAYETLRDRGLQPQDEVVRRFHACVQQHAAFQVTNQESLKRKLA